MFTLMARVDDDTEYNITTRASAKRISVSVYQGHCIGMNIIFILVMAQIVARIPV